MSFRTRIVINISILLFIFMMGLAFILVHLRAKEIRASNEKNALIVSTLTAGILVEAYENYYESGYYKFRQRILSLLNLDRELIRVVIYTVEGEKVFDSDEFKGKGTEKLHDKEEKALDKRIKQISPSFGTVDDKKHYDIVFPYLEPWGWHRYSVRYFFSTAYLEKQLFTLRVVIFSVTLVSVMLASIFANFQARAVIRPLEQLTQSAKQMEHWHFDTHLAVQRKDEIGILAEALNEMVNRIKQDMDLLESQKKTLSETNKELKKLNDLKSQFLANVSHELMTPLTSLKGYIEYMYQEKMGRLTEKQKRGLEVAKKNLSRLNKQILNLIDFSSFEAGTFELSLTPFHIQSVIRESVANLDMKLSEKEINFDEQLPAHLPPVIADRERIIQVLENLITNAIKFTAPGGKISVHAYRSNGKGGKIEVCVRDTGTGISKSLKKKIFEKFFQIDRKGKHKGLGLGLSIVKSILDAHNEKITVESKKGEGSCFCFTLSVYGGGKG
ncbi:MAG: HAMP domain-containing histidine kinase [Candidatus Cloacimonadota bacterium]|nr:MAG: HAMP domain-containing histidine kinase [Candidatus Cloacimonadota bacterium]